MEAELKAAAESMHAAWQSLKIYTRGTQQRGLRRTVRHAYNWLTRVREGQQQQPFIS